MINLKPDDPRPDVNFLKQLRDALFYETNLEKRQQLRESADNLQTAIGAFVAAQTFDTLTTLKGTWVHALRIWYNRTPISDGPSGGSIPLTKEQKAA